MRPISLNRETPYQLILCADSRLSKIDYTNDQIWELSLSTGEPLAITLSTTYGFRCLWMRLFPRFILKGIMRSDPVNFSRPPCLEQYAPNWIRLSYEPFDGIQVRSDYRAINSQYIAGRFLISNQSVLPQNLRLEQVALLNPLGSGESMLALQNGEISFLRGKSGDLWPVCIMGPDSTASPAPYPCLVNNVELYPGGQFAISWGLATLSDPDDSYQQALSALNQSWDADIARIEMVNRSMELEITTGNPEWDAALAFSQKAAWSLAMKGQPSLPNDTMVLSRQPDQGFSRRGDGSDYNHLWNGQTALDTWYLSQVLLPGGWQYIKGLVDNFIATQTENGWIDWKLSPSGYKSNHLCPPILATLVLQLHPYVNNLTWLKNTHSALLSMLKMWFSTSFDSDGDSFPEWQHPLQTGLEESPIYNRWNPAAQGIDIGAIEAPSLAAFLLHEMNALVELGQITGDTGDSEWLKNTSRQLQQALNDCWDSKRGIYTYRDAVTHQKNSSELLGEWNSAGTYSTKIRFAKAHRLVLFLKSTDETTLVARVFLRGKNGTEEIQEELSPQHFAWSHGHATGSTKKLFSSIREVEIRGMRPGDQLRISTAGYTQEDISLLLPLWAGIPTKKVAESIIENTLQKRFMQPTGMPICPPEGSAHHSPNLDCVSIPWNLLLAQGLVRYNHREMAAELLTSWLNAVSANLKTQHGFRQYYLASDATPYGEKSHLHGLIPVNFFLSMAGIKHLSPTLIILEGNNVFLRPIQVQYRRLVIHCDQNEFAVEYLDGPRVTLKSPGPHRVVVN